MFPTHPPLAPLRPPTSTPKQPPPATPRTPPIPTQWGVCLEPPCSSTHQQTPPHPTPLHDIAKRVPRASLSPMERKPRHACYGLHQCTFDQLFLGVGKHFRLRRQLYPFSSRPFNENFKFLKNCPYRFSKI